VVAKRSKLLAVLIAVLIVVVAVAAVILRGRMRCAGFPGPGVSAEELPATPARGGNLRVAVWNIRNFPIDERPQYPDLGFSRRTNICDLETVIAGLDADLLGLSEICDTRRFPPILRRAGGDRFYATVFAADGGRFGQHVGVAWDDHRLEIVGQPTEIDEVAVGDGLRPALAVYLRSRRPGGVDFTLVEVHLAAAPFGYPSRLRQYRVIADWVERLVAEVGDQDVLVVGDFNTTGAEDGTVEEEMEVLDRIMAEAGLERLSNSDLCSEYWEGRSQPDGVQEPALLDHVYLRSLDEVDRSVPLETWLHCRRHRCAELVSRPGAEDGTFWDVSDHCPLTFEIVDQDLD
jgi:endonuclease/exonuclease/phosphatase family metal-dependent hydrolase